MAKSRRLLILGGTAEATALAARCSEFPGLEVITSFAGRTSQPEMPEGSVRIGGFGGIEALAAYLEAARIDMIVDATHPFAARISRHAAEAAAMARRPLLMLVREPWQPTDGDRWIDVDDTRHAAVVLGDLGKRVFLTIGRQGLDAFAGMPCTWFLVRLIERPSAGVPLAQFEVVTGRGPFTVEAERSLMVQHRIESLVSKNSGGGSTYAKIAAARGLAIPVVMIRRPVLPPAEQVDQVDAAFDWVMRRFP
ncbi:MAG TPA: cobalt-precorrin-6A reductase [Alphaproteobacteria bacterium]|nr:cobalt-precorrin-6A reductase [Alphaproteobacteria bacterium]